MKRLKPLLTFPLLLALAVTSFPQPKAATKSAPVTDTLRAAADAPRDEKLWQKALKLQRSSVVVDTHNDILSIMLDENYDLGTPSAGKYHTDLARMKEGGLTAEFFSVYVDRSLRRAGRRGPARARPH